MKYFKGLFLLFSVIACRQQVPVNDIEHIPEVSAADSVYENVYQSLHGLWVGDFEIFQDESGTPGDEALLRDLTPSILNRPELTSVEVIRVHQRYETIAPFFQKVDIEEITDQRT